MAQPVIGLIHPGEMGAAVGKTLLDAGNTVLWASIGRSSETAARADQAGLVDAGNVEKLSRASDVILSICPPHAALGVARSVGWFEGLYVDANAVSPATAREIATLVSRFVDGGIVGSPPREAGSTRLYLSGPSAGEAAALFEGTALETRVVSGDPGDASAVKMAYAAWTKGTTAMLLAIRAAARAEGWSGAEGVRAQALELRDRLLALAGQDSRAYESALTALERKDSGLARALVRAAEVPLAIAETAADVAVAAAEAATCADGAARADASAAAALAAGAARAAARLVEVNLTTACDDERLARAQRAAEDAADAAKRASTAGA